jgi:hypothetical protein
LWLWKACNLHQEVSKALDGEHTKQDTKEIEYQTIIQQFPDETLATWLV